MIKRGFCLLLTLLMLLGLSACNGNDTTVIEFSYFNGNFSPFYSLSLQSLSMVGLTQDSLLVTTGDEDPVIEWEAYSKGLGIADIEADFKEDSSVFTIKVGKDIYFSDGTQLTAKDVMFSMYVYADLDYDGWSSLYTSDLDGLENYQYGTTAAETVEVTEEDIKNELENPSERTKELIHDTLIYPVLREEYNWVSTLYTDPVYKGTEAQLDIERYTDPKVLFAYYYSIEPDSYDASKVESVEQVVQDISNQYGHDYELLGDVYGSDLTYLANVCAKRSLIEQGLEKIEDKPEENRIRGIVLKDEFTLEVTINGSDEENVKNVLGIYVAPYKYYGEESWYINNGDIETSYFEIDSEKVAEKNGAPVGAGRYVFDEYKVGEYVELSRAENYYRDVDREKKLRFTETGDSSIGGSSGYLVTPDNRLYVES